MRQRKKNRCMRQKQKEKVPFLCSRRPTVCDVLHVGHGATIPPQLLQSLDLLLINLPHSKNDELWRATDDCIQSDFRFLDGRGGYILSPRGRELAGGFAGTTINRAQRGEQVVHAARACEGARAPTHRGRAGSQVGRFRFVRRMEYTTFSLLLRHFHMHYLQIQARCDGGACTLARDFAARRADAHAQLLDHRAQPVAHIAYPIFRRATEVTHSSSSPLFSPDWLRSPEVVLAFIRFRFAAPP